MATEKRVVFRQTVYPALRVNLGTRSYKFAGGELAVSADEADALQAYFDARPHIGVQRSSESVQTPEPQAAEGAQGPENLSRLRKPELVERAEAAGIPRDEAEDLSRKEIIARLEPEAPESE